MLLGTTATVIGNASSRRQGDVEVKGGESGRRRRRRGMDSLDWVEW